MSDSELLYCICILVMNEDNKKKRTIEASLKEFLVDERYSNCKSTIFDENDSEVLRMVELLTILAKHNIKWNDKMGAVFLIEENSKKRELWSEYANVNHCHQMIILLLFSLDSYGFKKSWRAEGDCYGYIGILDSIQK